MKKIFLLPFTLLLISCNNPATETKKNDSTADASAVSTEAPKAGSGKYKGSFSNGMKGATISFEVSEDGKEMRDVTFEGYWRCSGGLDLTTIGPEKSYSINNGKVDGVIVEPETGGMPFRFEISADIREKDAEGTLRFAFVADGCDTYKLNWTATRQ